MKLLDRRTYERYRAILSRLRERTEGTLGSAAMGDAATLALALEDGEDAKAAELAERLGLEVEELEGKKEASGARKEA